VDGSKEGKKEGRKEERKKIRNHHWKPLDQV
jgi:hypothetical protein